MRINQYICIALITITFVKNTYGSIESSLQSFTEKLTQLKKALVPSLTAAEVNSLTQRINTAATRVRQKQSTFIEELHYLRNIERTTYGEKKEDILEHVNLARAIHTFMSTLNERYGTNVEWDEFITLLKTLVPFVISQDIQGLFNALVLLKVPTAWYSDLQKKRVPESWKMCPPPM